MISWYVVHTTNQAVAKHIFDTHRDIRQTFYPVEHRAVGERGIKRARSLFPSYLFVRGELSCIRDIVGGFPSMSLKHVAKEGLREPMVIPDREMDVFISFNERNLDMMWLRNPYQMFTKNDRARIVSGPFAGYEGFVQEVKRDLKLIFRFGIWAVAISNVRKYDITIISQRESIPETGRMARLADYFTTAIREAGVAGNACEKLRETISGIGRHKSLEQYEKTLKKAPRTKESIEDISFRTFLREMGADDRAMLEQMARYIFSKEQDPVLSRIIPDMPLRPFLTQIQGNDGIPVDVTEGVYDAETDTVEEKPHRYYAHVIIVNNKCGSHTLITNWTYFYRQYLDMTKETRNLLLAKLEKYGISHFRSCLSDKSPVRFMELPEQGIAGLGTVVPKGEDMEKAQARLIEEGVALCSEISASSRIRLWQRHLTTVWIK